MFQCGICHMTSKPGEPVHRIVTRTRAKSYPFRKDAHRDGNDDPGGNGFENVTELVVCSECATKQKPAPRRV